MNIQQSYREANVRGAGPVELVVGSMSKSIEDLRQAAIAIEQNDIDGAATASGTLFWSSGICSLRWISPREARSPGIWNLSTTLARRRNGGAISSFQTRRHAVDHGLAGSTGLGSRSSRPKAQRPETALAAPPSPRTYDSDRARMNWQG